MTTSPRRPSRVHSGRASSPTASSWSGTSSPTPITASGIPTTRASSRTTRIWCGPSSPAFFSARCSQEATVMSITMRQVGPCFAAEVEGLDLRKPLTPEDVAAVHDGMDRYAVLVFHDQRITDEEQLAFTRSLGDIEHSIGTSLRPLTDARLPTTFADVSNLDKDHKVFARDDRPRLFGLGNRLWHSDSSFKVVPAKYSLLSARSIPAAGGNTEFADMRAAYDALDDETKAECENLICEHSQLFSRATLGFADFTDEERRKFAPVKQRL